MTDLAIAVRLLDADGDLVLDLTEANGYRLIPPFGVSERRWRRQVVVGDDTEGDVETQSVLEAATYELTVWVWGSSGSQVETRITNLLAAAEARRWQLEETCDGVTTVWAANRADSTRSKDRNLIAARKVPVALRVPVQPRPVEA